MSFLASLNPFAKKAPEPAPRQADPQNPAPTNPANPDSGKTLQQLNPLASFAKMYDTVQNTEQAPTFTLPDDALNAAAAANDFTRGFDANTRAAAMAGDSGAMMELMAFSNQQAYKAALAHGAVLTGKFTEAREAFNNKGTASRVRGELTADALADTPNFGNPVVKRQLIDTAERLQRQHPDASPKDIARMAQTYLTELSNAINPASAVPAAQQPTDWDSYFDHPGQ